jgi:fermentation-respiration switch protein FrsA (DUF1100 family)
MLQLNCSCIVSRFSYFPLKTKSKENQLLPERVEEINLSTEDNKRLQCFLIDNPRSKKIIIYFHGNAGNIYQRIPELIQLSHCTTDVLGVGYRGYGKSTGHPSEKGLYRDGNAAFNYVVNEMNYPPDSIIIVGRSIGTTVAINESMDKPVRGIILITPLTSGKDYARVKGLGILSGIAGNAFDNINKCKKIISPVLIIHGTSDEVIPCFMGNDIFNMVKTDKFFVKIKGGNHNNLEFVNPELYWNSIEQFITATRVD